MNEPVFGIDLGTTYSAITWINDYGKPEIIKNREGDDTTPSVVFFESDTNFVVGKEAKNNAVVEPERTVSLIKRQMGTDFELSFFGKPFRAETISALILKDLAQSATEETGVECRKVVITVPAYFGLAERQATRQAGEIAGLEVVGIVAEPVAAALSAGMRYEEPKTIFVYDLGGGTFDTTIMKVSSDSVAVVVTDGIHKLGGADWDNRLLEFIADKFQKQAGLEVSPLDDEDFSQRLWREVEDTKKALSRVESRTVSCVFGAAREKVEIERGEFELITSDLLERTLERVQATLDAAALKDSSLEVDEVLLVGGSSHMPMVSAALKARFGWEPRISRLDLAVAEGAALYGQSAIAVSAGEVDEEGRSADGSTVSGRLAPTISVSNVLPRSFGVLYLREDSTEVYVHHLAHAQDGLPLTVKETPVTAEHNQTAVCVRLFEQAGENESENVADNKEITPETGAVFTGLPNLPMGSPIEVCLEIDPEGLAQVSAFEPMSGQRLNLEVRLSVMQKADQELATQIVAGLRRRE
jgi:molecular chaperone DnaK